MASTWHADAWRPGIVDHGWFGWAAVRVFGVVGRGDGEDFGGIGDGVGEDGDAVERAAGGNDAARTEQAACGFEPDEVVECGGHAAGAGGVGAEGEVAQTSGHRHGGTGAGAAGDVGGAVGVDRHAVGRTYADEAGGELVEVSFAEWYGSGVDQALNDGSRSRWRVFKVRARGGGGNASEVDVVLDGESAASEWCGG